MTHDQQLLTRSQQRGAAALPSNTAAAVLLEPAGQTWNMCITVFNASMRSNNNNISWKLTWDPPWAQLQFRRVQAHSRRNNIMTGVCLTQEFVQGFISHRGKSVSLNSSEKSSCLWCCCKVWAGVDRWWLCSLWGSLSWTFHREDQLKEGGSDSYVCVSLQKTSDLSPLNSQLTKIL